MTTRHKTPILEQEIQRHKETAGENICIGYENLLIVARTLERDNAELRAALNCIAEYDGTSIWKDDRDDAADNILGIAAKALRGEEWRETES